MQRIKKILVGLDLTEMDETLIRYAAFICNVTEVEKVYFVHVERTLELPADLRQEFDAALPPDEAICKEMKLEVEKFFTSNPDLELNYEVVEGPPLKELAHWAKVKLIDLVVVGKKSRLKGSGVVPQKLAHIGRFDILFIPENAQPSVNHILVPVDFSTYSKEALERAISIAGHLGNTKLTVLNVYEVPVGHYKIGKSYEEMAERMRKIAEGKMYSFLSPLQNKEVPMHTEYIVQNDQSEAELVTEAAARLDADLVVMGAKGQSEVSAFMLGSFTERVVEHNLGVPLLIIKKKNEKLGFLDSLFID